MDLAEQLQHHRDMLAALTAYGNDDDPRADAERVAIERLETEIAAAEQMPVEPTMPARRAKGGE
jgi:hypothetical protein